MGKFSSHFDSALSYQVKFLPGMIRALATPFMVGGARRSCFDAFGIKPPALPRDGYWVAPHQLGDAKSFCPVAMGTELIEGTL